MEALTREVFEYFNTHGWNQVKTSKESSIYVISHLADPSLVGIPPYRPRPEEPLRFFNSFVVTSGWGPETMPPIDDIPPFRTGLLVALLSKRLNSFNYAYLNVDLQPQHQVAENCNILIYRFARTHWKHHKQSLGPPYTSHIYARSRVHFNHDDSSTGCLHPAALVLTDYAKPFDKIMRDRETWITTRSTDVNRRLRGRMLALGGLEMGGMEGRAVVGKNYPGSFPHC